MLLSVHRSLGAVFSGEDDDSVTLVSLGIGVIVGLAAVISGARRRTGACGSGVGDSDRSLGIMFATWVNGAVVRAFSAALRISGPCVSNSGEGRGVEWAAPLPDATGVSYVCCVIELDDRTTKLRTRTSGPGDSIAVGSRGWKPALERKYE